VIFPLSPSTTTFFLSLSSSSPLLLSSSSSAFLDFFDFFADLSSSSSSSSPLDFFLLSSSDVVFDLSSESVLDLLHTDGPAAARIANSTVARMSVMVPSGPTRIRQSSGRARDLLETGAQVEVALREGNFDAFLAERGVDGKAELARDDGREIGARDPDGELEGERAVTEVAEEDERRRLLQHVLAPQRAGHE